MAEPGNAPSLGRAEFEQAIVARAWQDPEYKKRLLANPKAVLEEELNKIRPGVKLPETLQVYVHEETPNALHLTLPVNPKDYGDLSGDEWMDDVTGGCIAIIVAVAAAATMTVAANVSVGANAVGAANAIGVANAVSTVNVTSNS